MTGKEDVSLQDSKHTEQELLSLLKRKKRNRVIVLAALLLLVLIAVLPPLLRRFRKEGGGGDSVTLSVICEPDSLSAVLAESPNLEEYLPSDGILLPPTEHEITPGETSVYAVTEALLESANLPLDAVYSPGYDSHYIRGIGYLYEFSAGPYSGWLYTVDGATANYGADQLILSGGETIVWRYTADYRTDAPPAG